MKRNVLLKASLAAVLGLGICGSTMGEDFRQWEPENGVPVRQGFHLEWFRSAAVNQADDKLCFAWSDTRNGSRNVYAQTMNDAGELLWGEEGKLIAEDMFRQEDPHVLPDGNGNWIITWVDYRNDVNVSDNSAIYITKVDADGNHVWDDGIDGTCVSFVEGKLIGVQSFSDGNGGAVSIWIDNRNGNADIFAQHISADGTMVWEANGMQVAGGLGDQGSPAGGGYTADTDGNGGIIFAWMDKRNASNSDIYANRVNAAGELVWSSDIGGIPVAVLDLDQIIPRLCPDGNGGAFMSWIDKRADLSGDLYTQHFNSEGTASWDENGVVLCNEVSNQLEHRMVASEGNSAIIIWSDRRTDMVTSDLYAQKITNESDALTLHWGPEDALAEGILVCDADGKQIQSRVVSDNNGGAFISWVDERSGAEEKCDLYGQHITQAGEFVWDNNGKVISNAFGAQNGNLIRMINGKACLLWADAREGSPGLYYQLATESGNTVTFELEENGRKAVYGLDKSASNAITVPSGDGSYFVVWIDHRYGLKGTYVFFQKYSSAGVPEYQASGKIVIPGYPDDETAIQCENLKVVSDNNGGFICTWIDNRFNLTKCLFAQRISADGTPVWGETGATVVENPENYQYGDTKNSFDLIANQDGSAVVIYALDEYGDEGTFPFLMARKINADGTIASDGNWASSGILPGVRITTQEEASGEIVLESIEKTGNSGSIFVVYTRYLPRAQGRKNIYARKLNADGSLAFNGDEIVICNADDRQWDVSTTLVRGGVVVAWEDKRAMTNTDIYAQLVNSDGSLAWDENGIALFEGDGNQNSVRLSSKGRDFANDFWAAWIDQSENASNVIVQRFNLSGNPQLENNISVGDSQIKKEKPVIKATWENGLYVFWEDVPAAYSDLRMTHVDVDGSTYSGYDAAGNILCDAYHKQSDITVCSDSDGGFVATWVDNRSTGKATLSNIYVQRVNDEHESFVNDRSLVPEGWTLDNAYPNPFNPTALIRFTVAQNAQVTLTVYDVLGREVAKLVNKRMIAGSHQIVWNGTNSEKLPVSSGMYFYRLQADNVDITKSMILMK